MNTVDERALEDLGIDVSARTDAGRDPDKQVNEDSHLLLSTPYGFLAVVCDGMGGHEGGRAASQAAIGAFLDVFKSGRDASPPQLLSEAAHEANRRVFALGGTHARTGRPGSTLVAMLISQSGLFVVHVGDSRLYRVQNTSVGALTKDHSVVQQFVDAGVMTAEEAAVHPDANRITRALGISETVVPEVTEHPHRYVAGETFLLCSDGLSDLVKESDFLEIIQGNPLKQAVGKLVDLANARGGHDNITAVLVHAKRSSTGFAEPTNSAPTALLGGGAHRTEPAFPAPPNAAADAQVTMLSMQSMTDQRDSAIHVEEVQPAPMAPRPIPVTAPHVVMPVATAHPEPDDDDPPRNRVAMVIGVICALVALGAAAFVILHEFGERRGKHHESAVTASPGLVAAPTASAPAALPDLAADPPAPMEPLRTAAPNHPGVPAQPGEGAAQTAVTGASAPLPSNSAVGVEAPLEPLRAPAPRSTRSGSSGSQGKTP